MISHNKRLPLLNPTDASPLKPRPNQSLRTELNPLSSLRLAAATEMNTLNGLLHATFAHRLAVVAAEIALQNTLAARTDRSSTPIAQPDRTGPYDRADRARSYTDARLHLFAHLVALWSTAADRFDRIGSDLI